MSSLPALVFGICSVGPNGTSGDCFQRICFLIHKRDAWEKNKDLDLYEARWLYVEALLKVGAYQSLNL